MPALPKTSDAGIVAAARAIIARDGAGGLSLARVASAVGIKAPSLYKRFADRSALVEAVREDVRRSLAENLRKAARQGMPIAKLVAMGRAYRKFGRANPLLYPLVIALGGEPSAAAREAMAPVFEALLGIVGEARALPAARCLTAYLHGFLSMEITGGFRLGGSVDEAFEFGLATILSGLQSPLPKGEGVRWRSEPARRRSVP